MGELVAVCLSEKKGQKKHPVPEAELRVDHGLLGDAHAGKWHRQVSLLDTASIAKMVALGLQVGPGDFAENLTTSGLELFSLPIGTKLRVGEAILEITQIGKICHDRCAIYQAVGDCVMPKEGVFARVLAAGTVRPGDSIEIT